MSKARILFHKLLLTTACLLLVIGYPLSAAADGTASDGSSTPSTTGPAAKPAGANYWFDPTTGHWNSNQWVWDRPGQICQADSDAGGDRSRGRRPSHRLGSHFY